MNDTIEKTNTDKLQKIDRLYSQYLLACAAGGNEIVKETYRQKIIVEFWKLISSYKSYSTEMKEHTDKMIELIDENLKSYSKNIDFNGFAACTLSFIKLRLKAAAEKELMAENFGGMGHINAVRKRQKKIKKLYEMYKTFSDPCIDEKLYIEDFKKWALEVLDISEKDLKEFFNPSNVLSEIQQNEDGEEISLFDNVKENSNLNYASPETKFFGFEYIRELLHSIDDVWIEQKKNLECTSSLLTQTVIQSIDSCRIQHPFENDREVMSFLQGFRFIDNDMLHDFYEKGVKLPSQKEIGEQYGLEKSATRKRLERIIQKVNRPEI